MHRCGCASGVSCKVYDIQGPARSGMLSMPPYIEVLVPRTLLLSYNRFSCHWPAEKNTDRATSRRREIAKEQKPPSDPDDHTKRYGHSASGNSVDLST